MVELAAAVVVVVVELGAAVVVVVELGAAVVVVVELVDAEGELLQPAAKIAAVVAKAKPAAIRPGLKFLASLIMSSSRHWAA